MATMGVRVQQPLYGGTGSGLGALGAEFAKAMWGDPEEARKNARLRADLAMDEYQKRQYDAAIAHYNAQTQSIQNEQQAIEGAVPGGTAILKAAQGGRWAGDPEAPAPVEPFSLPETTNEFPLQRSAAFPDVAPVEPLDLSGAPAGTEPAPLPDVAPVFPAGPEPTATGDFIVEPGPTPGTKKVTNKNTGQTAILTEEQAAGVVRASQYKANPAAEVGQYAGEVGVLGSPDLTEVQKRAALLEGKVPSRESIVGTDEAIRKDVEVAKQTAYLDPAKSIIEHNGIKFRVTPNPDDPVNGVPTLVPIPNQGTLTKTNAGVEQRAILDGKGNLLGYENIPGAAVDPARGIVKGEDGLQYQINQGADGKRFLTLLPGQEEKRFAGDAEKSGLREQIAQFNTRRNNGIKATADELSDYNTAYEALYGDEFKSVRNPDNTYTDEVIKHTPPAGTRRPEQANVLGQLPEIVAQQRPAEPAPAPTPPPDTSKPYIPSIVQEGSPYAPPRPPDAVKQAKSYGGYGGDTDTTETTTIGGTTITRNRHGDMKNPVTPEWASKTYQMVMQAIPAMKMLDDAGLHGPGMMQRLLIDLNGQDLTDDFIKYTLTDEDSRSFARALQVFINSQLRPDTGATIKWEEVKNYSTMFIQPPNATEKDYVETRNNRNNAILSRRLGLNGLVGADQLRRMDEMLAAYGKDLEEGVPGKGPAAAEAEPAPPTDDTLDEPLPVLGDDGIWRPGG
jgi:hypothetical protein